MVRSASNEKASTTMISRSTSLRRLNAGRIWSYFTRRKQIDWYMLGNTDLKRCLTTVDLTALGIGATLGAGAYVLAGQEANATSGPSVMLSFLIAAIASLFAGLCYAEFGARVPKAGSAYVYSYVTVGELIAFFIGWNLLLEYVIGTASVASAWSGYLDSLLDGKISTGLNNTVPMHLHGLGPYPDFVAFGITMLLTCVVAFGVGESAMLNNILTVVNLLVIAFVIVCGLFKASFHNWALSQAEVNALKATPDQNVGVGGFFPWGAKGMLTSASSCFYGFVGFDAVATTAEEAKNPQRSIPLAITISLVFIFVAYFGISAVITLMSPYPLLLGSAPLPVAFERHGWHFAKYIISVGALAALTTSLFGGMFPMPRIVYAMGTDGLIFKALAKIYPRTKTPVIATFLTGFFTAIFAMIFSLTDLINMMSIGTLLAYTLVAICVIILRYSPEEFPKRLPPTTTDGAVAGNSSSATAIEQQQPKIDLIINDSSTTLRERHVNHPHEHKPPLLTAVIDPPPIDELAARSAAALQQQQRGAFHWQRMLPVGRRAATIYRHGGPTEHSSTLVNTALAAFTLCCFLLSANIVFIHPLTDYAYIETAIFIFVIFAASVVIALQPKNPQELAFRVPLAPYLPLLSVFINSYLMMSLPVPTWIRFIVWLAIGLALYLGYGVRHSHAPVRGDDIFDEQQKNRIDFTHHRHGTSDGAEMSPVSVGSGSVNRGFDNVDFIERQQQQPQRRPSAEFTNFNSVLNMSDSSADGGAVGGGAGLAPPPPHGAPRSRNITTSGDDSFHTAYTASSSEEDGSVQPPKNPALYD